jgi:hypothetical protein
MRELYHTIEALKALDGNYDVIMRFLAKPEEHFALIDLTLKHHISKHIDPELPITVMTLRYDQAMNLLHDHWWGNTYPLHDVHFHKSFEDYVNCPFTCLTEVIDCMDKILQGKGA